MGAGVVALYVLVLWIPGLALGALAGLRGWTLAAAAPLLTYAVAGLFGPLFAALGIAWSPMSAGLLLVVLCAVGVLGRYLLRQRLGPPEPAGPPTWSLAAHAGVAAGLAWIVVVGGTVIWSGLGQLNAIPQDWDAAFHANGIRWIADTGDSSLTGMAKVNWYAADVEVFYPNAYHLVAAVVLRMTGADIPTVLNAHTVLLPGMGALTIVALVHRFRGRALLAVTAAGCSIAITSFYDMLWRGPLLPFVTGAVLMPLAAVLLVDVLDTAGWRQVGKGLLFGAGLLAMIALNPATLFTAAIFTFPALVQRWAGRPRLLLREPLVVLAAGAVAALMSLPQVLGSIGSASGEPVHDWPAELTQSEAFGELLGLAHDGLRPQWWLVLVAAIGLAALGRLADLRWIFASGFAFGTLFVLAASSDEPWVNAITRPWWNDQWRLVGMCVVPIAVLGGHGLAELQRHAATRIRTLADKVGAGPPALAGTASTAVATALVVVLFVVATDQLYLGRNVARMRLAAPDGPVVSSLEADAMRVLATLVPPDQRVMNDRGDGSVWMYALAGVHPVAGFYNFSGVDEDALLLNERFNRYPVDRSVRAAVARLNVTYVMLGRGFVRTDWRRAPGLLGLEDAPWLQTVYRNRDAVIYRIRARPA
ncbi:MAG TPA: DUF6541 family protein [Pseudonocardia sp.]|uniref:DUF6541 family protein n=1 Tax=Pseudonocardia sp. TaxID=60912 RepID=UPI002B4AEFEC|nr:DUF6541 family protein [Pseudonocardia sp.]HLU57638.1 DUF6541 family protein [Pseudonocardia sp.]